MSCENTTLIVPLLEGIQLYHCFLMNNQHKPYQPRMKLSKVMHLEGCHMCRSSPDPIDAMTVDFNSNNPRTWFQGRFNFVIHAACTTFLSSNGMTNRYEGTNGLGDKIKYDDNPAQLIFTLKDQQNELMVLLVFRYNSEDLW